MSSNNAIDYQSLVKNSLKEIRKLKGRIAELEYARVAEPIAVIGMACRFPQQDTQTVQGLDAFRQLLMEGFDAVREAPSERFSRERLYSPDPDAAGKITSLRGGFLDDIDRFAAEFFFISPREAESMDPQQRLLLETHWRALEHAGIPAAALMDSKTGLFVGICGNDYYHLLASREFESIDSYMASGTAHSTAAGRLAFFFGSRGPAVAIDTACSSSLVALHLACRSLRDGESDLALASGVNALLSPEYSINFSRAGMLSPDGRCKTFDDDADGYVRGEGCGVVVLKRLADALRDGDQVLAVVKGSAVNQDGRSSGLTAPNGSAQRSVIEQALRDAGLDAAAVGYVEAHGTGTRLGDPIEIEALQYAYGRHKKSSPLWIGSIKSNIAHLEGAAGIAGFIKAVLMLQQRMIPKQLHFHTPNRHVDWSAMNLAVSRQLQDWAADDGKTRIAGVSSFGFGGTNAHVLVAEAPEQAQRRRAAARPPLLLTLSAHNSQELQALKQSYFDYLQAHPETDIADFCYTANARRDHFQQSLAICCARPGEIAQALSGDSVASAVDGDLRLALLFTGQGAFNGAIDDFSAVHPLFAEELASCAAAFKQRLGVSLSETLFTVEGAMRLSDTQYAQPALFCFQYALAKAWMAWGVKPDCLVGHSIGEYAAACLANVFSFDDALALVCLRGRLMTSMTEPAGMMAVLADAETVAGLLRDNGNTLSIAACNGPANTVVSGRHDDLQQCRNALDALGLAYLDLKVDRAFHSHLMEPMLAQFAEAAGRISYRYPEIDIISTYTGRLAGGDIANADYWVQQIRRPVLFTQALDGLLAQGVNSALEIGPQNVLAKMVNRESCYRQIKAIPALQRGADSWHELQDAVAELYRLGADIHWNGYYHGFAGHLLNLPGYPFTRQRYWFKTAPKAPRHVKELPAHSRLTGPIALADEPGKQIYSVMLSAREPGFHQDHRYRGRIFLPAAYYLELAVAAVGLPCRFEGVNYPASLLLDDGDQRELQLVLTPDACFIYSRSCASDSGWLCHFNAQRGQVGDNPPLPAIPADLGERLEIDDFYRNIADRGIAFGSAYRLLTALSRQDEQAHGTITTTDGVGDQRLYPPMLDACFQVAGALLPEGNAAYLQTGLESCCLYRAIGNEPLTSYVRLRSGSDADTLIFDIDIMTGQRETVAQIIGMRLKKTSRPVEAPLYHVQWQPSADDVWDDAAIDAWLAAVAETAQPPASADASGPALAELEQRALAFVSKALLALGWDYRLDDRFNTGQCRERLGILPRYEKLLQRCLMALGKADVLDCRDGQWRVIAALEPGLSALPPADDSIEMQLLKQCGQDLSGVLSGHTDFLTLLFPPDGTISAAALYRDAAGFKALNDSAARALAGWLELMPKGRPLRILEIGAGTGGTTRVLLPLLKTVTPDYRYTDLSAAFFAKAETDFTAYPFIRYQTLDISRDPKSQGFNDGEFDCIIAANVIHATADLNITLAHIRRLLSQAGVLMLLEGLEPQLWVDLVFGLTAGWWAFTDQRLQQGYPLLDAEGWRQALTKTGFGQTSFITPKLVSTERLCRQSVILTRPLQMPVSWLVLRDKQGVAERFSAMQRRQGVDCLRVDYGENFNIADNGAVTVNPMQARDFERLMEHWQNHTVSGRRAVMHCQSLDAELSGNDDADAVQALVDTVCAGTLHLVQALKKMELAAFNFITQGSQAVNSDETPNPATAVLWGLGRVVAREYPQFNCRLLDLNADIDDDALNRLSRIDPSAEQQSALRGGQWLSPRLAPLQSAQNQPLPIDRDGVYLVTGAFGGMGLKLAQWLIELGAEHLLLVARSAPSDAARQWLEQARAGGVMVVVEALDVSDYRSLKQAVQKHCAGGKRLAGVFHAAGVFADCLLQDYDWRIFSAVFPAKVQGAWNLHRLSIELKPGPDYFILFSSAASILAVAGLANYVAANAFIDALAAYRRGLKLPALSINWGVWDNTGMATAVDDTRRRQWQAMGVAPMPPDSALAAMRQAMASGRSGVAIMSVDFNRFVAHQDEVVTPSFYRLVLDEQRADGGISASAQTTSLRQALHGNAKQQAELVQDHVSATVASVLGITSEIDPKRGFFELGMDSLTSLELRNRLQRESGCLLDATLTFKYPSVSTLSAYLLDLLSDPAGHQPAEEHSQDDAAFDALSGQDLSILLDAQLAEIDRLLKEDL